MTAFMSLTSIFNCLAINRPGNNNLEAAAKTTLDSFLFRSKEPIKRRSESTKLIASLNFWPRKSCNFVASVRCFRSLSRFRGNQPHLISKSNPAVFLNAWMQKTIQISSLAQLKSSRDQVLALELDLSKLIKTVGIEKLKIKSKAKAGGQKQCQNNGRSSSEEQVCPVIAPWITTLLLCVPSPLCSCFPSPLCHNSLRHRVFHCVLAPTWQNSCIALICVAVNYIALHCNVLRCIAL